MKRESYDPAKEHELIGMYPAIPSVEATGIHGLPATPQFYRPIERRENMKMLFRGETPYWIPVCGVFGSDLIMFRPRQNPDNFANHQAFDGGEIIDYTTVPKIVKGWFDLDYKWEENIAGATVKPGPAKVPDITRWEEYITMPNLDLIDWNAIVENNKDYLAGDRLIQLGIQFGMWERLMNLMGVSEAAIALIDEDQQDGVHRFFDQLSDFYIDYIRRLNNAVHLESVFLHDDWGTSTGPFFSLDTCREMIVPYIKKVVDECHRLGLIFEHHSCGNAEKLVPAMIEEGDDFWCPQPTLNNIDDMIEKYKDSHMTFGVASPVIRKETSDEEIREMAKAWVEKYKDKNILLTMNADPIAENDMSKYPIFADAVYEYSRIAYQDVE